MEMASFQVLILSPRSCSTHWQTLLALPSRYIRALTASQCLRRPLTGSLQERLATYPASALVPSPHRVPSLPLPLKAPPELSVQALIPHRPSLPPASLLGQARSLSPRTLGPMAAPPTPCTCLPPAWSTHLHAPANTRSLPALPPMGPQPALFTPPLASPSYLCLLALVTI